MMHWIDPASLPETEGVVASFLLNADAEADGFLLEGGTEVHFPPHMAAEVIAAVRAGSRVRVRGVRPRGVAMIAAVAINADEGREIIDGGPQDDDAARKAHRKSVRDARTPMTAEGVLRQVLHGPKGEPRGLLLEDGRSGRFPPHAADAIAGLLVPGTRLSLSGDGTTTEHGTVIAINRIGASQHEMQAIASKPKDDKAKKRKNEKEKGPPGRNKHHDQDR